MDRGIVRGTSSRVGRHRRCRGPFEHRYTVRVRTGLSWRDLLAPLAARASTFVPRPVRTAVPNYQRAAQWWIDDRPDCDHMDTVLHMAGTGHDHLFLLQPQAQRVRRTVTDN